MTMTRLLRVAVITAIWVALWGDVTVANVAGGVLVAVVIGLLFGGWHAGRVTFRPIAMIKVVAHFVVRLVVATVDVVRAVLWPRRYVRPGIIEVPLLAASDSLATAIASAIGLTPGTMTLDVRREPPALYVHALDASKLAEIRSEIHRLEILAVEAFGDDAERAALADDDPARWGES